MKEIRNGGCRTRNFSTISIMKGHHYHRWQMLSLADNNFPLSTHHPNRLTPEETDLMNKLRHSFQVSEKLHKHIRLMLQHGCMYAIYNNNLLFHASNSSQCRRHIENDRHHTRRSFTVARNCSIRQGMLIRTAFQTTHPKKNVITA